MNLLDYNQYGHNTYYRQSNRPHINSLVWLYEKENNNYIQVKETKDGWVVFNITIHNNTGVDMTQIERNLNAQSAHRIAYMNK